MRFNKYRSVNTLKKKLAQILYAARWREGAETEATIGEATKKPKTPESRAERFAEAVSMVADAKQIAEDLKEELSDWQSNIPDSLQGGDKSQELESAIEELDTFINECDEAEQCEVNFPGIY